MGMTGAGQAVLGMLGIAIIAGTVLLVGTSRPRLAGVARVTAALTFVLVIFGAFVRLNDAGLGCPDWPGCYGALTPGQSADAIAAETVRHPAGPVSLPKAWKEMLHRYLAMVVGCLIVALAIAAFRNQRRFDAAPVLALVVLAVVLVQGAFGALTVTLLLKPAIVTTHLLGGLTTLALLTWLACRLAARPAVAAPPIPPAPEPGTRARPRPAPRRLRPLATCAALVLLVQLALGGWVSTNYAAAACGDLPLCQQQILPDTDFKAGFHPFRELGRTADDAFLPLSALTAIHLAHRGFAIIALLTLLALARRAIRTPGASGLGIALAIAVLGQIALGVGLVAALSPDHLEPAAQLPIAAAHNAGAATLVVLLTLLNFTGWSGSRSVAPASSALLYTVQAAGS